MLFVYDNSNLCDYWRSIYLFWMIPVTVNCLNCDLWRPICSFRCILFPSFFPFFPYSCNFQSCNSEQVQSSGTPQCIWKADKVRKWVYTDWERACGGMHAFVWCMHVSDSTSIWNAHYILPSSLILCDWRAVVKNSHLTKKHWRTSSK